MSQVVPVPREALVPAPGPETFSSLAILEANQRLDHIRKNTETFSSLAILEANQRLDHIRKNAELRRQKAQSYTGDFPENPYEQAKALWMMQSELNHYRTIEGMSAVDYARQTIDELLETLTEQATSTSIERVIGTLKQDIQKEEKKLLDNTITPVAYIENCTTLLLQKSKALNTPQTFFEYAKHLFLNTLRSFFRMFDKFFTWIQHNENTKANTPEYKPYIEEPKTSLALHVESFEKKIKPLLQQDLQKKMEKETLAQAREARIEAAKKGQHPKQNEILKNKKDAQDKKAAKTARDALLKEQKVTMENNSSSSFFLKKSHLENRHKQIVDSKNQGAALEPSHQI